MHFGWHIPTHFIGSQTSQNWNNAKLDCTLIFSFGYCSFPDANSQLLLFLTCQSNMQAQLEAQRHNG